jgi:hypothetical protein
LQTLRRASSFDGSQNAFRRIVHAVFWIINPVRGRRIASHLNEIFQQLVLIIFDARGAAEFFDQFEKLALGLFKKAAFECHHFELRCVSIWSLGVIALRLSTSQTSPPSETGIPW